MSEPEKPLWKRALDGVLGTVKLGTENPERRTLVEGPKSGKEVFSLTTRRKKQSITAPKGRFLNEAQVKKNRWEQFVSVFGKHNGGAEGLQDMRGIQRAIIPNTYGNSPYQAAPGSGMQKVQGPEGFAAVPAGFSGHPRDKGGNIIPGGAPTTYVPPATHTGPTHFATSLEDDREYQNYLYNSKRGNLPAGTSWADYAKQRKAGKLDL
jgi:hypothetical protein